MENYGIDTIKKALKFAGSLTKAITDSLEDDGQVKGTEYFKIALTLPGLIGVIRNAADLKDEFYDLSDEEMQEIKDYFAQEFDIPNDEIEEKIENAFNLIIAVLDSIFDFIPYGE